MNNTVASLVAAALDTLRQRVKDEVLVDALSALMTDRQRVLQRHAEIGDYLGRYWIPRLTDVPGPDLAEFIANSERDAESSELTLHAAVRWWMARDAVWPQADAAAVIEPVEGDACPHDLLCLRTMLASGPDFGSHKSWLRYLP